MRRIRGKEWRTRSVEERIDSMRRWQLLTIVVLTAMVGALTVGLLEYRSDQQERARDALERRNQDCRKDERKMRANIKGLRETYHLLDDIDAHPKLMPGDVTLAAAILRNIEDIEDAAFKPRLTVAKYCDEEDLGLKEGTRRDVPPDRRTFDRLQRRVARLTPKTRGAVAGGSAALPGAALLGGGRIIVPDRRGPDPPTETRQAPQPSPAPAQPAPAAPAAPAPAPTSPSPSPPPQGLDVQVCGEVVRVNCREP